MLHTIKPWVGVIICFLIFFFSCFTDINSLFLCPCMLAFLTGSLALQKTIDNIKLLLTFSYGNDMFCKEQALHKIDYFFPSCAGSLFVYMPHFWSQMECCPDVGLSKDRRKVCQRALEGDVSSCLLH